MTLCVASTGKSDVGLNALAIGTHLGSGFLQGNDMGTQGTDLTENGETGILGTNFTRVKGKDPERETLETLTNIALQIKTSVQVVSND